MADLRRCIGSAKFGIGAHEAPPEDFPAQPSQRDGLGRMCKPHWNQYTSALRKASLARRAADGAEPATVNTTKPARERASASTSENTKPTRERATKPTSEKPTLPAPARHVELLDPPTSSPRRKPPADAAAQESSIE